MNNTPEIITSYRLAKERLERWLDVHYYAGAKVAVNHCGESFTGVVCARSLNILYLRISNPKLGNEATYPLESCTPIKNGGGK